MIATRHRAAPGALLFWLWLALYALTIVVGSDLGPGDEFAFLPTLQSGGYFPAYNQDFPYFDPYENGRFVPLGGQEYNLVALLSNAPWAYFAFNAAEFVAFALLFAWLLRRLSITPVLAYAAVALVCLMPAVTLTFFKLLYVEKNVAVLLAVFFASYLKYGEQRRWWWLLAALASANLALYSKETMFALLFAFAATHALLCWKQKESGTKLLDGLLVLSALGYLAMYLVVVFPHRGATVYNYSIYDPLLVFAKNVLNYGLFSDPVPMLLLPLAAVRAFRIVVQKRAAYPFVDALVAAGAGFVAAYLALNIYSPYYLLPTYLCALPALLFFWKQGHLRNLFWKAGFAVIALALVGNTLPSGIHYLTYNKYLALNFNETVDYLAADIGRRADGKRANIFLDGVDRGTGQGTYLVFGEFLKFKGLSILKFDMKTDTEAVDKRSFVWRQSPFDKESDLDTLGVAPRYPRHPFTVFQGGALQKISSGDYLVVTPQTTRYVDDAYLQSLLTDYTLVFRTRSRFAVPDVNLKTAVKSLVTKSSSTKDLGVVTNRNLWNWPDYYVFVRR